MIDTSFVTELKQAILQSRYRAAQLANRELLSLYFRVGKMISERAEAEKWGSKVLEQISAQLQQELPGLRGVSAESLKRMRRFYTNWKHLAEDQGDDLLLNPHGKTAIGSTVFTQLKEAFPRLGFSHHMLILHKTETLDARSFYIIKCAEQFWSVRTLKHHLNSKLFESLGQLPNNFSQTLTPEQAGKAIRTFKDSYLLDFINLEDPDEEDERVLEQEIIRNIQKFLQSLGPDFAFIGNQHRVIVDEQEFFIDLVFFHRGLQCLIAFDLKRGKFKSAYLGQMNFYLSALDEYVKQAHENPSIGIILCKEKSNTIVEFAIRDMSKPMGVATYDSLSKVPEPYQKHLPDPEDLRRLMG